MTDDSFDLMPSIKELKTAESEKDTEALLVRLIKQAGGKCKKLTAFNDAGWPDRLCLLPRGLVFFVELKSQGRKLTKLQAQLAAELKVLGHTVHVLDTKAKVKQFMRDYVHNRKA